MLGWYIAVCLFFIYVVGVDYAYRRIPTVLDAPVFHSARVVVAVLWPFAAVYIICAAVVVVIRRSGR